MNPPRICNGDDWARPRSITAVQNLAVPVMLWNDFSNMNGGWFPGHTEHREGLDIDGWFNGYNTRDVACANTLIAMLNNPLVGPYIERVLVTFRPLFQQHIANVTLVDGRAATAVIRNAGGHSGHFHIDIRR